MKEKLKAQIGQPVRITKGDDCSNQFFVKAVGILEYSAEDDSWFVRISDGPHGTNGIGFNTEDVYSCKDEVYLYHIELR